MYLVPIMAYNPVYLVFFILALVYAILTLFSCIRTFKLYRFSPHWSQPLLFYFMILFASCLRTVAFLIIFFEQVTDLDSFFLLLSVPDSVFTLTFILLFWQMVMVFRQAHMDDLATNRLLRTQGKRVKSRLAPFVLAACIGWVLLQSVLYFVYGFDVLDSASVGNEVGAANLLFPTIVVLTLALQHFASAGSPIKSAVWSSKLRKVRIVTMVWAFGRYFRGVLSLITAVTDYSISQEVVGENTGSNISHLSLLIAYLIICEVICVFLVLDYGFVMIFVFIESENEETSSNYELRTDPGDSARSSLNLEAPPRHFSIVADRSLVLASDVEIETTTGMGRKLGLGQLHLGRLYGHQVLVRKVTFPRISGYVIEEFEEEVQALKSVSVPCLLPLHAASVSLPEVQLVVPYVSGGSLYSLLHTTKRPLTQGQKVRLGLQLAQCLSAVYQLGRKHGHITSHNVLVDNELTPFLSDLGMFKLKKYAGILIGYCNKSAWSSPELLAENCPTALKVKESDDVYSFGVLLWELLTGQEPFPGLSRHRLSQLVSKEGLRPEIPKSVDDRLGEVIKSCWNVESARRPTFPILVTTLEALTGVLS